MNETSKDPSDEPLRAALRVWRVESSLPPRFGEKVWNRIERSHSDAPVALWPFVLDWFKSAVTRPAWAVAYASLLLVVGLGAGLLHAQHENAKFDSVIAARYVQSIDPYQK